MSHYYWRRLRQTVLVMPLLIGTGMAAAPATAVATTFAASWRVTDLGMLPGACCYSEARAVNDRGLVVGVSDTAQGSHHAVLWRNGRIRDLGTLGGVHSESNDVNRHGMVVGTSQTSSGAQHAFVWKAGRMTDLGTLGGSEATATAVNDLGWVVGFGTIAANPHVFHAFLWKAGRMTDLGTLVPGAYEYAAALDVDNHGRVVGRASVDGMNSVPVMWQSGRIHRLTDRFGEASAVNDRGQVAGFLYGPSFLWYRGTMTQIGPVNGSMYVVAEGIDRRGRIVGHTDYRAFVWDRATFNWLPGLTTGTSAAKDINRRRQIVGSSATSPAGLNSHAVIWTRR
jgi:probable HAF family extracellular repeat protein